MNLGHGWNAAFLDGPKRVICSKPGAKNSRRLCYEYVDDFRGLRRVDVQTGAVMTDPFNRLPEDTLDELRDAARERWA